MILRLICVFTAFNVVNNTQIYSSMLKLLDTCQNSARSKFTCSLRNFFYVLRSLYSFDSCWLFSIWSCFQRTWQLSLCVCTHARVSHDDCDVHARLAARCQHERHSFRFWQQQYTDASVSMEEKWAYTCTLKLSKTTCVSFFFR